jgi:hypothetical protein
LGFKSTFSEIISFSAFWRQCLNAGDRGKGRKISKFEQGTALIDALQIACAAQTLIGDWTQIFM